MENYSNIQMQDQHCNNEGYYLDADDVIKVSTKKDQLKCHEFLYNKHERYSCSDSYRCSKYHQLKCTARIKYHRTEGTYYHIGEHNHSPQESVFNTQAELNEDRKAKLYEFIKANTQIESSKTIRDILNNDLTPQQKLDPKITVKIEDVQKMKRKFYGERITCLQDLFIRPDIAQKENGEQFVRWVQGYPFYILIFASNHQMNLLKSVTNLDQIYVDGTFDFAPQGFDQLLTVFVRKRNQSALNPVVFSLLQGKDKEIYWFFWWIITYLAPELREIKKLTFTADFEKQCTPL
jgi:hypothetical protein